MSIKSRIEKLFNVREDSHLEKFKKLLNEKENLKELRAKLILQKDEKLLYYQNSILYEERAIRNYSRTGYSIRITKGWWYHIGSGKSESHGEMRKIDSGVLYITSKRFIFTGKFKSYNYNYKKLISIEPFSDSVRIAVEGRQKTLTFTTENPILLGTSLQILSGDSKIEKDARNFLENELKKEIVSKIELFGGNLRINIDNYDEMSECFNLYTKYIDFDTKLYSNFLIKIPQSIVNLKKRMSEFSKVLENFNKELNNIKNKTGESAKRELVEYELDKVADEKYGKNFLKDSLREIIN